MEKTTIKTTLANQPTTNENAIDWSIKIVNKFMKENETCLKGLKIYLKKNKGIIDDKEANNLKMECEKLTMENEALAKAMMVMSLAKENKA